MPQLKGWLNSEFQEKLEYVLNQVCPYDDKPPAELTHAYELFEAMVDECCKLDLLPSGAYARLAQLMKD